MTRRLVDYLGGDDAKPFVYAVEMADKEMATSIGAFAYDAGLIASSIKQVLEPLDYRVDPVIVEGNVTNHIVVQGDGRKYLVEITPLNF